MKDPKYDKIMGKALKYLSFRDLSEKELKNKLRRNYGKSELIEKVCEELKRIAYLDDRRYVHNYIVSKRSRLWWGKNLLFKKLVEKGVCSNIIHEVFDEYIKEEDEYQLAKKVFEKKINSLIGNKANETDQKKKHKAARHLENKGFPVALIIRLLEENKEK